MITQRLPLYSIRPECHLFKSQTERADGTISPEEAVRQWCAFELIRAYGFSVSDFVFEHPVKVGSKNLRIDIVILKGGRPWAIVECKRPEHKRSDHALEQAVSYAKASKISAEFAVYTNGTDWLVRRKIGESWITVLDLPNAADPLHGRGELLSVLETFQVLLPILHSLDKHVEGAEALEYLSALQVFFLGENLVTQSIYESLRNGLDNLLRSLSAEIDDAVYQVGKLKTAYCAFSSYSRLVGIGLDVDLDESSPHPMFQMCRRLQFFVLEMAKRGEAGDQNVLALRLASALLDVGVHRFRPQSAVVLITAAVHSSLRALLEYGLAVHLGMRLPAGSDSSGMAELRLCTAAAWDARD